jgi:hypothetical protein
MTFQFREGFDEKEILSTMQTDELVAGRELDALVAEKVMGWDRRLWAGRFYWSGPYSDRERFSPSMDIAAAWEVVERVWQEEWVLRRFLGSWQILDGDPLDNHRVLASAETAPLAICRAALQAVAT